MRGDAVRELALRAVDDADAWAVLADLLEEEPQHRIVVAKLIFRAWGQRRWPMIQRLTPRLSLTAMSAILKRLYPNDRVNALASALHREAPVFRAIAKRAPEPLPPPSLAGRNRHERRAFARGRR